MKISNKQTRAFTMIELVFVIVVIGILAALALPRLERDIRQEAADNILSAIRYTQHLALTDNKTDPFDLTWQKKLWAIRFDSDTEGGFLYKVASNTSGNNIAKSESAIDPSNGKHMFASNNTLQADESPNVLLGKKYGIDTVDFTNCESTANGNNASTHIAFDHLGRPHKGVYNIAKNDYRTVMTANCIISFGFEDGSANLDINISKETGYAFIVGQEDS
ncbi:MAG: prepilin-type cleavage/methylation domain-containing protein [Sulfurovum sp.]|nr:MAG: prepilin-type cleavage/methylation domain-containing protein [Sulfurovum sp.]